jgi:predicted ATPase
MIKSISIQNFKCYQEETHFDLKQINLLTGINGKGKSTFLQSILLMAQSSISWNRSNGTMGELRLNDSFVRLGTFDDVRNAHTSRNHPIIFRLNYDNKESLRYPQMEFLYRCKPTDDDRILAIMIHEAADHNPQVFPTDRVCYVSADRLGPQEFYTRTKLYHLQVGKQGENVGQVLVDAQQRQFAVNESLALSKNRLLVAQVGEWLGHILDNKDVSIVVDDSNRYVISLLFKIDGKTHTMPNVGFGYSYILPIIVSGLIAKPDSILIIENPEAHLHPKAQSNLTKFLAKVAETGVQIFIESHSEHILNALRVVSVRKDFAIQNTDLSILYFQEAEGVHVLPIPVNAKGGIDNWPESFFDQEEQDLAEIFKLTRKK